MLSSGNGRHRRPRPPSAAKVTMATAAATSAGIALPLFGATTAQAADSTTWDRVAFCETGGMWHANIGNGFFGGLAITQDTWDQYGGDAYAQRPDLATEADQIAVAENMLTDLGPGAWPGCETGTGLLQGTSPAGPGATAVPTPALPGEHTPATVPTTPVTVPAIPPITITLIPTIPTGPATGPVTPPVTTPPTGGTGTPGTPSTGPVTPPVTPTTPATPPPSTSATPPSATQNPGGTATLAPTDPSGATPTTSASAPGAGRHAKPYSPTDEQLAAQDQATRTQILSVADNRATAAATSVDTANKAANSGTSAAARYTVAAGDSLSGIADAQHVAGGWHQLYDLNRPALGANPNLIKPGQILNLR
jgi:resuscitation-promoting factor RpfA